MAARRGSGGAEAAARRWSTGAEAAAKRPALPGAGRPGAGASKLRSAAKATVGFAASSHEPKQDDGKSAKQLRVPVPATSGRLADLASRRASFAYARSQLQRMPRPEVPAGEGGERIEGKHTLRTVMSSVVKGYKAVGKTNRFLESMGERKVLRLVKERTTALCRLCAESGDWHALWDGLSAELAFLSEKEQEKIDVSSLKTHIAEAKDLLASQMESKEELARRLKEVSALEPTSEEAMAAAACAEERARLAQQCSIDLVTRLANLGNVDFTWVSSEGNDDVGDLSESEDPGQLIDALSGGAPLQTSVRMDEVPRLAPNMPAKLRERVSLELDGAIGDESEEAQAMRKECEADVAPYCRDGVTGELVCQALLREKWFERVAAGVDESFVGPARDVAEASRSVAEQYYQSLQAQAGASSSDVGCSVDMQGALGLTEGEVTCEVDGDALGGQELPLNFILVEDVAEDLGGAASNLPAVAEMKVRDQSHGTLSLADSETHSSEDLGGATSKLPVMADMKVDASEPQSSEVPSLGDAAVAAEVGAEADAGPRPTPPLGGGARPQSAGASEASADGDPIIGVAGATEDGGERFGAIASTAKDDWWFDSKLWAEPFSLQSDERAGDKCVQRQRACGRYSGWLEQMSLLGAKRPPSGFSTDDARAWRPATCPCPTRVVPSAQQQTGGGPAGIGVSRGQARADFPSRRKPIIFVVEDHVSPFGRRLRSRGRARQGDQGVAARLPPLSR